TEILRFVRDQLCFFGFCSAVQVVPSETSGPDLEQSAGFRDKAALCFPGRSSLQTGEAETKQLRSDGELLFTTILGSEEQNLQPQRSGPQLQHLTGLRSPAAGFWTGESKLQTGNSKAGCIK
ncbi:hypothetical protein GOODEAATRI_028895, partial [Goodea atripinnis]